MKELYICRKRLHGQEGNTFLKKNYMKHVAIFSLTSKPGKPVGGSFQL